MIYYSLPRPEKPVAERSGGRKASESCAECYSRKRLALVGKAHRATPARYHFRRQYELSAECRCSDVVCLTHLAKGAFHRALSCSICHPRAGISAPGEEPREKPRRRRRGWCRGCRTALRERRPCRCANQGGRRDADQATQSANYGVPIVATSFGAAGTGFRSGHDLLLADRERDFAQACIKLLIDRKLSCRLAQQARRMVRRDYDGGRSARRFLSIIWAARRLGAKPA